MRITKNNIDDVYKSKLVSVETMQHKGYELISELFVDSSGFGTDDEMALTKSQFIKSLNSLLDKHGALYTTITNCGQFQVYVGLFKKTGNNKSKKIANNTITYTGHNGYTCIRLYDTDILKQKDGVINIYNGGYFTRTTKERINKYLPYGYYISQKDFEWYLNNPDGTVINFVDGMAINGCL